MERRGGWTKKGEIRNTEARGRISDRFLDNYVNANVLAGRSAANNVITESHYCTHAWISCDPLRSLACNDAILLFLSRAMSHTASRDTSKHVSQLWSAAHLIYALLSRHVDWSLLPDYWQRNIAMQQCVITKCLMLYFITFLLYYTQRVWTDKVVILLNI